MIKNRENKKQGFYRNFLLIAVCCAVFSFEIHALRMPGWSTSLATSIKLSLEKMKEKLKASRFGQWTGLRTKTEKKDSFSQTENEKNSEEEDKLEISKKVKRSKKDKFRNFINQFEESLKNKIETLLSEISNLKNEKKALEKEYSDRMNKAVSFNSPKKSKNSSENMAPAQSENDPTESLIDQQAKNVFRINEVSSKIESLKIKKDCFEEVQKLFNDQKKAHSIN
jgi:hypothetical protein